MSYDKLSKNNAAHVYKEEEKDLPIIEDYKELNIKCDSIINKIKKRKLRKNGRKY